MCSITSRIGPAISRRSPSTLEPGARIAIIDYHAAQSPHKDQPNLIVSKEQAARWLADAGLKPAEDITLFTEKWFLVYAKGR